jgi:peptide/nickel transport system permease protein
VICRHAIPNLIRPCLVYSMSDVVLNIVWIASLSYLGLGVQPPTPEWGSIIADGQPYLLTAWWITTLPGLVVVIVGIGFSLVGDGLADRLRAGRVVVR